MGRLAEHYARVTGETRRTLTRSWRKVRGKRWKTLRARLGELHDSAATAGGAQGSAPLSASADLTSSEATFSGQPPEPEARSLKH
jgi:hypothetical protein